jgi:hypothetical protein
MRKGKMEEEIFINLPMNPRILPKKVKVIIRLKLKRRCDLKFGQVEESERRSPPIIALQLERPAKRPRRRNNQREFLDSRSTEGRILN